MLCERNYWESQFHIVKGREVALILENEKLKAKLKLREQQLFGRKTEKGNQKNCLNKSETNESSSKRNRGQQAGTEGHGRIIQNNLPVVVEECGLDDNDAKCKKCGLPYALHPTTEDSEIIEIEVKPYRRRIKRKKYIPTCTCPCNKGIIIAPGINKLIPKGMFGISFWVQIILTKYCFQQPLTRYLYELTMYGLNISAGTITDGIKRIAILFERVNQEIIIKNKSEHHWHADETGWMVFIKIENKKGHHWWLWVFQSETTIVFKIAPSRGAKVVKEYFGEDANGIINADRYIVYKTLLESGRFLLAYCWAHVRRDFIRFATSWQELEVWAFVWIERIGNLYYLNEQRIKYDDQTEEFNNADEQLRKAVTEFHTEFKTQLSDKKIHPACKKILLSLQKHWSGLTLFVDYSWIPMDNNPAERTLRGPVVGRKNYYGSGSLWSAEFTAGMFTILHTLELWGINPRLWLTKYLQTCADNNSKPPETLNRFLPWTMTREELIGFGSSIEKIPKNKPVVLVRKKQL